jgi:NAD(P)H-hydrate epimerase
MKKNVDFMSLCESAVTSAEMKEIERKADEAGLSYYRMMESAGTGAAEYIISKGSVRGKTVLIFCGKGNNGGDGFVAARKLSEAGASVILVLAEGEPRTEDAIKNRRLCGVMSIPEIVPAEERELEGLTENADLILDAVYGTGFHGELREPVRKMARQINRSKATVYSLDIPSGLNGDTGEADEDTIRADCTIVFHRLKPAHEMEKSRRFCGKTVCVSIGIEEVLK